MAPYWHQFCRFVVDGTPKAQPRIKGTARGGFVRMYTPDSAKAWKNLVELLPAQHIPAEPFRSAVRVDIKWKMPRPKRLMRLRDPAEEIPFTPKPDRDNLDKAVLDAMENAGWFVNDSYVTAGYLEKVYHAKGDTPGAVVTVWTWR